MPDTHAPELILAGGTDSLRLEENGKEYRPGDAIPRLSQARRLALQAAGIRFETRHHEPVVTPDGKPAEMAAAEQMPASAVVAAVEDVPASKMVPDEKQPRRALKE